MSRRLLSFWNCLRLISVCPSLHSPPSPTLTCLCHFECSISNTKKVALIQTGICCFSISDTADVFPKDTSGDARRAPRRQPFSAALGHFQSVCWYSASSAFLILQSGHQLAAISIPLLPVRLAARLRLGQTKLERGQIESSSFHIVP